MLSQRHHNQPQHDQDNPEHLGRAVRFLQDQYAGKKTERQTHLAESLNITDVRDIRHCKQNQAIGAGTADSRKNRRNGMQKWQYIGARCLHIGDITIRKN